MRWVSRNGVLARLRTTPLALSVPKPHGDHARNLKRVGFARAGAKSLVYQYRGVKSQAKCSRPLVPHPRENRPQFTDLLDPFLLSNRLAASAHTGIALRSCSAESPCLPSTLRS